MSPEAGDRSSHRGRPDPWFPGPPLCFKDVSLAGIQGSVLVWDTSQGWPGICHGHVDRANCSRAGGARGFQREEGLAAVEADAWQRHGSE